MVKSMITLNIGDIAPDFTMPVQVGIDIKLSELKGKIVVLYFYPKDDTPGCTLEAQEFSLLKPEFDKFNTIIIGVSKDDINSHHQFKNKYCLQFALASDTNSNTCEQYGAYVEKSLFGKKYKTVDRVTFLIDQDGKIRYIWPKVSARGHAKEVLNVIKKM